jgi:hypothetical protein
MKRVCGTVISLPKTSSEVAIKPDERCATIVSGIKDLVGIKR